MCQIFAGIPRGNYECETRSVRLSGHATSIRLEAAYWDLLERLAEAQAMPLGRLLTELHEEVLALHGEVKNFTSLLRCVCLLHLEREMGADAVQRAFAMRAAAPTVRVTPAAEDALS